MSAVFEQHLYTFLKIPEKAKCLCIVCLKGLFSDNMKEDFTSFTVWHLTAVIFFLYVSAN